MANIFFTSDPHYGHENIIKYTNRPFSSIGEMNEALIENWNNAVSPGDVVYLLGDVMMGKDLAEEAPKLFNRLNGEIHVVWGNHDTKLRKVSNLPIASAQDYLEVYIGKQLIVLSHYAFRVWNRSHLGSYSLYGHSHGTLPDDPHARSMDVGVDAIKGYRPVSFDEVRTVMAKKQFKSVDYHEEGRGNATS